MKTIGVIPARLAASRFPNKPMARILGIPMIGHVYFRSKMCSQLGDVWVATCDKEIFDYVLSIGGKAVMTAGTHERASDRCAEAMLEIEKRTGEKTDILAMVQGDEPMVHPDMISEAVDPMRKDSAIRISNLSAEIKTEADFEDPNQVKVVVDRKGDAIYFSREPIPSRRKFSGKVPMMRQLGLIAFRRDALLEFTKMAQAPLEIIESVDMLRFIENGIKIRMSRTRFEAASVDTLEDLRRVETLMAEDALVKNYVSSYAGK